MDAMESLSEQVRVAISRGDYTMTSLAIEVGCSRQHLHAVLSGKHQMSLKLAEQIAEAVGCELRFQSRRKKVSA